MEVLIGIILLLSFIWFHYKKSSFVGFKKYYFPALIIKIVAGVSVGLLYKYYYAGGDTWNYFYQAEVFSNIAFQSWDNFANLFFYNEYQLVDEFAYVNQPRAALMVKLVALVNLITRSNYWITSAYFSFFSFVGLWAFSSWVYKTFTYGKIAALILFIWPSFVFWSSGILKESIAVGLIFWIIANYFTMMNTKSFRKIITIVFAVYLLFLIKYYFAVVLLVVLIIYGLISLTSLHKKGLFQQTVTWGLLLTVGLLAGGFLHPNLHPSNILGVVIKNNIAFAELSNAKNLIHFMDTSTEWVWLIINSPKALFAGLFMPLSFNKGSLVYSIYAIENWLLILLFVRGVTLLKLEDLKSNSNLILASGAYIIMLAIFLSLSTPNLGTLSRYKVAYMPILLVAIIIANKIDRVPKLLGKLS